MKPTRLITAVYLPGPNTLCASALIVRSSNERTTDRKIPSWPGELHCEIYLGPRISCASCALGMYVAVAIAYLFIIIVNEERKDSVLFQLRSCGTVAEYCSGGFYRFESKVDCYSCGTGLLMIEFGYTIREFLEQIYHFFMIKSYVIQDIFELIIYTNSLIKTRAPRQYIIFVIIVLLL